MPAVKKILILSFIAVFSLGCQSLLRMTAKGGSEFVMKVETNEPNKDEIFQQAIDKLKYQINRLGLVADVSEIPGRPYHLKVKIYDPKDIERIKKVLFTNYQLELKKAVSPPSPVALEKYPSKESAQSKATENQEVLPYNELYKKTEDEIQAFVIVEKEPVITGRDIHAATVVNPGISDKDYSIQFNLTTEGAAKFGDWTNKNINNYLAIVLNKKAVNVPYIKSQITESGQIDGRFTKEEAEDIALSLNSGFLPADFKVLSEEVFGEPPR